MSNPKPRRSLRRSNRGRGQALVEFAIVFPIFMIVLVSLLYFGFALYSKMSVINAAREGAHAGILLDPADAAFAQKISDQAKAAAGPGLNTGSITITSGGYKVVNNVVTATTCTWGSGGTCKAGDSVSVTVTYPFGNPVPVHLALLGNVIIDLPNTVGLTSTVQMIHE
jgi:Flp pilus assembly protein TadG